MNYHEDFSDPMAKVQRVMETIDAGTAADRDDDARWCRAWRDTLWRMNRDGLWAADKACRRVINSRADEDDKALARRCLRLVRDGYRMALRVDFIDSELADLYPADLAKSRLETELGYEQRPGEAIAVTIDRACMLARVRTPGRRHVEVNAFAYLRSQFYSLEIGG